MAIEYILLLIAVFFLGLKAFTFAPRQAFKESGPRLAAQVENQMESGRGFKPNGVDLKWIKPK